MKKIISRIKMKKTECLFVDKVNRREVFKWIDHLGQSWMAQSRFGLMIKL